MHRPLCVRCTIQGSCTVPSILFSTPRFGVCPCLGCFLVSHCVLREHPPTHLDHGRHNIRFTCLTVILGELSKKFQKKFTALIHLPLVAVFYPSSFTQVMVSKHLPRRHYHCTCAASRTATTRTVLVPTDMIWPRYQAEFIFFICNLYLSRPTFQCQNLKNTETNLLLNYSV